MTRRRGFALVEMLFVLIPMILLVGVVILASNQAITTSRRAAAHADRMATLASLRGALIADARSAAPGTQTDDGAISIRTPDGVAHYEVSASEVTRHLNGQLTQCWSAERLTFAQRIETGSSGILLVIVGREARPAKATVLADRAYLISVSLPLAVTGEIDA